MDTRERALQLLGSGQSPLVVAQALGVDHSRVSQLLAEPEFARQVAELRFKNLQDQAARDKKYDGLEDKLLEKLADVLEYITKPGEVLRALMAVNAAKRRGVLDPTAGQQFNTVVQLQLPSVVQAKFRVDAQGVIISVGERPMVTMPADVLIKEVGHGSTKSLSDDGPACYESIGGRLVPTGEGSSAASSQSKAPGSDGDASKKFTGVKDAVLARSVEAELAKLGI